MVTHEPEIAAYAKRQIVIRDGVIPLIQHRKKSIDAKLEICYWLYYGSQNALLSTMIGIIGVVGCSYHGFRNGMQELPKFHEGSTICRSELFTTKSNYVMGMNLGRPAGNEREAY